MPRPRRRAHARAAALVGVLAALALAGCASPPWTPPKGPLGADAVDIRYFGQAMVAVSDRVHAVVVDPFGPHVGFPIPKASGDLVLVSAHQLDTDNVRAVLGSPRVFAEPGVFVLGDVRVIGVPSAAPTSVSPTPANVMFRWRMAGIDLVHLGKMLSPDVTDEQLALLRGADVMFVPVGGYFTLDASGAAAVVRKLNPRIVVPTSYKVGPSTLAVAGVEDFLGRWDPSRVRTAPSDLRVLRAHLPARTEIWLMDWR